MTVEDLIRGDWASEPSVMDACLNIWQTLSEREFQLDHYTFGELVELAKSNDEAVASRALLYLASPKIKVLSTCLMYEFDGGFFELPKEEISHFARGETVIHPESGSPLLESELLVCFTPGPRLQSKGWT